MFDAMVNRICKLHAVCGFRREENLRGVIELKMSMPTMIGVLGHMGQPYLNSVFFRNYLILQNYGNCPF